MSSKWTALGNNFFTKEKRTKIKFAGLLEVYLRDYNEKFHEILKEELNQGSHTPWDYP